MKDGKDDSNPQQGSGSQLGHQDRRVFKIPPTKKDERKLFVGGLPAHITEHEFREFFSQFGELIDSVVMFDRETRRSRGFGFVTFEDPQVCQRLLHMGGGDGTVGRLEMQGKICEVKSAQPKEKSHHRTPLKHETERFPGSIPPTLIPPTTQLPPASMSTPPHNYVDAPMIYHPPIAPPHFYHPYVPQYPMYYPPSVPMEGFGVVQPDYRNGPPVLPAFPVDTQIENLPFGYVMPGMEASVMQPAPPGNGADKHRQNPHAVEGSQSIDGDRSSMNR